MNTKEVFCFIPAKSTSQRLKDKNKLILEGFPLYFYPINAALKSELFDESEIVLSSDSDQILENASLYGATPFKRSKKLSKDPSGVYDVLLDFIQRTPQYRFYKYVIILLPTSPLTIPKDILESFNIFKENNFDCLLSVSLTNHNAQLAFTIENSLLNPLFPNKISLKSQELQSTYHANGAIHIVNIEKMISEKSYLIDPIGAYIMPFERSIDIDTKQDLDFVKYILSK